VFHEGGLTILPLLADGRGAAASRAAELTQRTTFLCGRRISRNCGYQRPGQQPICARRRQPATVETLVFTRPPGLAAAGKFFAWRRFLPWSSRRSAAKCRWP